jgi:hypothetical protein
MFIGRRDFGLLDLNYDQLDAFVKEVHAFSTRLNISEDSKITVNKDQVVCCGIFPIGISIDIEAPTKSAIKELDVMMYAKVLEICERDDISFHDSEPLKIL